MNQYNLPEHQTNLLQDTCREAEVLISRFGRAPRVLLIGNLANNAYYNAKILRQYGLEAYVVSFCDYPMSLPQWEETAFINSTPNLNDVRLMDDNSLASDLPAWFVKASFSNINDISKDIYMSVYPDSPIPWLEQLTSFGLAYKSFVSFIPIAIKKRLLSFKKLFGSLLNHPKFLLDYLTLAADRSIQSRKPVSLTSSSLLSIYRSRLTPTAKQPPSLESRVRQLVHLFKRSFPNRSDQLSPEDIGPFLEIASEYSKVIHFFDFVIGFCYDGLYPLLTDVPYFAFEHGTLRDLPYEDSSQGRAISLVYSQAYHTFVSNTDCVDSAYSLVGDKFTQVNHPFDEDIDLVQTNLFQSRDYYLDKLDSDFLFFLPSRHDWDTSTAGYADKSTDVFLNAFIALRKAGFRPGMITCTWGADWRKSEELLRKADVLDCTLFMPPLPMQHFYSLASTCDMVVDQFKLGSIGGVFFKSAAVGAPILTYLNDAPANESIPVFNCQTTQDILDIYPSVLANREMLKSIGNAAQAWVKQHHSKHALALQQLRQFNHLTDSILQK